MIFWFFLSIITYFGLTFWIIICVCLKFMYFCFNFYFVIISEERDQRKWCWKRWKGKMFLTWVLRTVCGSELIGFVSKIVSFRTKTIKCWYDFVLKEDDAELARKLQEEEDFQGRRTRGGRKAPVSSLKYVWLQQKPEFYYNYLQILRCLMIPVNIFQCNITIWLL